MTRLNAGTHRVIRLSAAAVGVAAIMLVSACGAGQIAETAKIKPAVPGGSGSSTVPADPSQQGAVSGTVYVQNVTFDFNDPAGYAKGASAPLNVRIVNGSSSDLELTGVTARAMLSGVATDLGTLVPGSAATPAASPSGLPSPSGPPAGSPSPGASPSAAPSEAPPTAPAAPAALNIKIPANQLVDLSRQAGQYIQVSNLPAAFKPGDVATLVFTFKDISNPSANIADIALQAQIGPPVVPVTRSSINIAPSGD